MPSTGAHPGRPPVPAQRSAGSAFQSFAAFHVSKAAAVGDGDGDWYQARPVLGREAYSSLVDPVQRKSHEGCISNRQRCDDVPAADASEAMPEAA